GVGLALAAGGLSLAELASESPGDDQAGSSVSDVPVDDGEPSGEAAEPGDGKTSAHPDQASSAAPGASASTADSKKSDDPDDKASKDPKPPKESPDGGTSPTAPATSQRPTTPNTTPPAPKPTPTPSPTPSETCDRFLWWCT
ncbi:hypothetical protein P8605_25075, partial [Streptomyces sp. T-3]|nr:hypothetical protein [Streptomyces sp. T-3]